jgi:ankyrin repeat protein
MTISQEKFLEYAIKLNDENVDFESILKDINQEDINSDLKNKTEIIFYLIKNFPSIVKDDAIKAEIDKNLTLFLEKPENNSLFEEKDKVTEKNILFTLLGMQRFFSNELILQAIKKTQNIDQITFDSSKNHQSSPRTPIDYLITQQANGENVSEVAIALIKKGAKITKDDNEVKRCLLEDRAAKNSDLTKDLCLHLIKNGDNSLFIDLILFQDKRFLKSTTPSNQSSNATSRKNSTSSISIGVLENKASSNDLFSKILNAYLNPNFAKKESVNESIPSFLLRTYNKEPEYQSAKKLWSLIQSKANFKKIPAQDFTAQDETESNFFHHLAKLKNADILKAALFYTKDKEKISLPNFEGNLPIHIACENGFDNGVAFLASLSDLKAKNNDGYTPLAIAVKKGLGETVRILLNIGTNEYEFQEDETDKHPLALAVKENKEGIFENLLANGHNPNLEFCDINGSINDKPQEPVTILDYAIFHQNFDCVKSLIYYGASSKKQCYTSYKKSLSAEEVQILEDLEVANADAKKLTLTKIRQNQAKIGKRKLTIRLIDKMINFLESYGASYDSPYYTTLQELKKDTVSRNDIEGIEKNIAIAKKKPRTFKIISFFHELQKNSTNLAKINKIKEFILAEEHDEEELYEAIDSKLKNAEFQELSNEIKAFMIENLNEIFPKEDNLQKHIKFIQNNLQKIQNYTKIKETFELYFNLEKFISLLPAAQKEASKTLLNDLKSFNFKKVEEYYDNKTQKMQKSLEVISVKKLNTNSKQRQ